MHWARANRRLFGLLVTKPLVPAVRFKRGLELDLYSFVCIGVGFLSDFA